MGIHPTLKITSISDTLAAHPSQPPTLETSPQRQVPIALLPPSIRPGLALIPLDGVQHDLDGVLRRVALVPLAPVVRDGVGEDAARLVEGRRDDGAADGRVPLEAVLGVLVPEVERAVGAGGAEGAVDGVEGDVVYGVDGDDVVGGGLAVTLEGKVGPVVVSERITE